MLGYAVRLFFDLFRRDVTKRKYRDFYEYKEAKKDKQRSSILFLLIIGCALIVISVVFLILYYHS